MTPNDQAFVKSFSRRRLADSSRQSSFGVPPTNPVIAVPERPSEVAASTDLSASNVWSPPKFPESIVGERVSAETPIARSDEARTGVPRPHVEGSINFKQESKAREVASEGSPRKSIDKSNSTSESPTSSVDPLQHIHTAYAGAFADPKIFDATASTETPDLAPTAPEVSLRLDVPSTPDRSRTATSIVPFQAVWEVDVFDVPTPVADLFFEGALFQQIAERMSDAVSAGLKCVLVTSSRPGEGRSCVAMGMAMAAAAAGIRVALVDADVESPSLADELRLDLQCGWVDVIRRGLPVKEVAVHAVEDGVTLIPLMPPSASPAATAFEMVQLMDLLKSSFELVIVDGPTALSPAVQQLASKMDSAVIVRDVTRTDESTISEFAQRLHNAGTRGIGVVENFV